MRALQGGQDLKLDWAVKFDMEAKLFIEIS